MRNVFLASAAAAAFAATPAFAAPTNVPALQSTIKYTKTATGAQYFGNYARATSKVVYDAAAGTYVLRDTGSLTTTSTFGPSNINAAQSDASYTVYSKNSGAETLKLLNQSPTNPTIALSYVTYGHWRRNTASGTNTNVNDTYVVFGSKTPGANVPRTGSATYSTLLDGTFVNSKGAYAVDGTGTLTANFAGGTIGYSATATGTKEVGTGTIDFGTMTGTGTIAFASAGFNGTGTTNANGYKLNVAGNFYGPAAQEVGGVFQIVGNRGSGNGTGAIVGK